MNVYVSVDIEGISGVVHGDMMMAKEREYDRGCRLMTADANAAIQGLVEAGADYILVNDSHGPMRNLLIEEIHPRAHLLSGSGNAVAELRLNGRPHGETGLNAAVLASLGIPTIFVSGDTTTVAEARDFLPDEIETVAVKTAVGHNAAICRPLADARADITAATARALAKASEIAPYLPETPWRLEVDFLTMLQCDRASRTAGVERLGPTTILLHGETPWEQYRNLWAGLRSALYEPAAWLV
jgi:D-amino peptidase